MASEKLAAGLVNSGYSVGWVGACTVGVTATETELLLKSFPVPI